MEVFLEITRNKIFPKFVEAINDWTRIVSMASWLDWFKFGRGYLWVISNLDSDTQKKVKKIISDKFINQWYFMGLTKDIVSTTYETPPLLKQGTGKFLPLSDAKKC